MCLVGWADLIKSIHETNGEIEAQRGGGALEKQCGSDGRTRASESRAGAVQLGSAAASPVALGKSCHLSGPLIPDE